MCAKLNEQLREYKRSHGGCVCPLWWRRVRLRRRLRLSCPLRTAMEPGAVASHRQCFFSMWCCECAWPPVCHPRCPPCSTHPTPPLPLVFALCRRFGAVTDDDTASLSSWASESSYNTTPSIHSLGLINAPLVGVETAEAMARRYSTSSQLSTASLLRTGQPR
jgi:hypothetical protein